MGLRRDGREAAIQFLYQYDTHKPGQLDAALAGFWKQSEEKKAVCDFAAALVRGAAKSAGTLMSLRRRIAVPSRD